MQKLGLVSRSNIHSKVAEKPEHEVVNSLGKIVLEEHKLPALIYILFKHMLNKFMMIMFENLTKILVTKSNHSLYFG